MGALTRAVKAAGGFGSHLRELEASRNTEAARVAEDISSGAADRRKKASQSIDGLTATDLGRLNKNNDDRVRSGGSLATKTLLGQ